MVRDTIKRRMDRVSRACLFSGTTFHVMQEVRSEAPLARSFGENGDLSRGGLYYFQRLL